MTVCTTRGEGGKKKAAPAPAPTNIFIDPRRTASVRKEHFFGRAGEEIEKPESTKFFGKIIAEQDVEFYYIRMYQNLPYDPLGPYSRRNVYRDTKLGKVSKDTFNFYMLYLQTNNSKYLTQSQRGILND